MSTLTELLEAADAQFRALVGQHLRKRVEEARPDGSEFAAAVERLERAVELRASEEETADSLRQAAERKEALLAKYEAEMERWKNELAQAVAQAENTLLNL